ncbi:DUF2207 domain-containing protein [Planococcus maitriensis]|uniref:DUF2207 domain-containing protein n=1 Tax=Planococcus maitriensis TaxID=221799 RepID=A0A365K3I8_9BACL|nr:DUF2207 domain-containing protein [Planococcus maitriensis]RAZ67213.1 DUF2207 domain-containing protein [Planococcus maitriensis]
MKNKKGLAFVLFIFMLLVPAQAFAIDFDITDVEIEAQLNEDGTVDVTEQFTYEFEDDFEGITRSLNPKEGTSIEEFTASDSRRDLEVEVEDGLYKIYRSGNDGDTTQVELNYRIVGAVEKFEDGAEFYWPFFDASNESDYGDMTITVIPPAPSSESEALGYGEAFDTTDIREDGTIVFDLGDVPSGENADIRAIFEPGLFPGVIAQDGTVRDELANGREELENEAAVFARNQQRAKAIGIPAIAILGALLIGLVSFAWIEASRRKREARSGTYKFFVPEDSMSIPALLHFTHPNYVAANGMSAAILDLMRKGKIRQLSDDHFELLDRSTDHPHEAVLIGLLFDTIGDGQAFTLEQVEAYTKNELNHEDYNAATTEWNKEVKAEVTAHDFYEKHIGLRWGTGVLSAVFIGLAIVSGIYGLLPWMAISIALAMLAFVFAVGYSPITREGHRVRYEWRSMKTAMEQLPAGQWEQLTMDEKQRAYAYLLGSDLKTAERKAKAFTPAEPANDVSGFAMNPILMTAVFVSASTTTSATASASGGGMAGTGGGVGGGGGGSGAF